MALPIMPTQPCPPEPPSFASSSISNNQSSSINFNCGAQTIGMSLQQRQQAMRQKQLAMLEKQRNRKPFGAVANDIVTPAASVLPTGKTGWGKIIGIGVDQPGCMADEPKKSADSGGLTVIKTPGRGSSKSLTLEEDKGHIGAQTPAKSPSSAIMQNRISEVADEDVFDLGTCDEVRCGRNGDQTQRNKILRETDQTEHAGGWDMHIDECVRVPSPVVESTTDMNDAPVESQGRIGKRSKFGLRNPFKKEAPAPAPPPAPVKKPVKEDTGMVTAISTFDDVPSTPPEFSGPNGRCSVTKRTPSSPQPGPRPGRRNRGDQAQTSSTTHIESFSSQERSSVGSKPVFACQDPFRNSPRNSKSTPCSNEITCITSMGAVEDDEDKPKFSRPKRSLRQGPQDVLPGCLDEPEDVIGWD